MRRHHRMPILCCYVPAVSLGEGTIERAVVFEHTAGPRKLSAQQCLTAWPALFDTALSNVDLGLRAEGPLLFALARFRSDQFSDEVANRFSILARHAGGTEVPISDLSILERANFLTRLEQCAHHGKAVLPDDVPQMFERLFAEIDSETAKPESAKRTSVRYAVTAPVIVTTEASGAVTAAVEDISKGGAFVRTENPAPLQAALSLEIQLPTGPMHAKGKVVNVSPTGMGIQFTEDPGSSLLPLLEAEAIALEPVASPLLITSLIEPAVAPAVNAPPGVRFGDYELLSLLGKGGMGEVHYARAVVGPWAGQFFAIKQLNARMAVKSDAVERFVIEGQTHSKLDHPNIVKTYEARVFDGRRALVMEVVDGRDVGQIVRRCKSRKIFLPVDFACFLVKKLLDALDAVHHARTEGGARLNLVHCDVSPHNLFISRVGEIKLGDFGLAKQATDSATDPTAQGRPAYLSPEAIYGRVSVLSDLWAAAVTFYELLTFESPFTGDTIEALSKAIRKTAPTPANALRKEVSPALEAVLAKALAKKPKRRYQSAAEFAAALAPHFDPEVGTPLAIAAVVRGLFPDRKG